MPGGDRHRPHTACPLLCVAALHAACHAAVVYPSVGFAQYPPHGLPPTTAVIAAHDLEPYVVVATPGWLYTINVTNTTHPRIIAEVRSGSNEVVVHGTLVMDNRGFAYVAVGLTGVAMYNVTDVTHPSFYQILGAVDARDVSIEALDANSTDLVLCIVDATERIVRLNITDPTAVHSIDSITVEGKDIVLYTPGAIVLQQHRTQPGERGRPRPTQPSSMYEICQFGSNPFDLRAEGAVLRTDDPCLLCTAFTLYSGAIGACSVRMVHDGDVREYIAIAGALGYQLFLLSNGSGAPLGLGYRYNLGNPAHPPRSGAVTCADGMVFAALADSRDIAGDVAFDSFSVLGINQTDLSVYGDFVLEAAGVFNPTPELPLGIAVLDSGPVVNAYGNGIVVFAPCDSPAADSHAFVVTMIVIAAVIVLATAVFFIQRAINRRTEYTPIESNERRRRRRLPHVQ